MRKTQNKQLLWTMTTLKPFMDMFRLRLLKNSLRNTEESKFNKYRRSETRSPILYILKGYGMNDYELHQLDTDIKIGANRVNTLQFLRDLAIDLHRIVDDMIAYYDKHEQDMFIENRLNYLYTIANLQEEIDYYLDIMQNNFWTVD